MKLEWVVKYQDENAIYEDSFNDKEIALERYRKVKEEGYKNIQFYKEE